MRKRKIFSLAGVKLRKRERKEKRRKYQKKKKVFINVNSKGDKVIIFLLCFFFINFTVKGCPLFLQFDDILFLREHNLFVCILGSNCSKWLK